MLALSNLQNSIIVDKGTMKLQDFQGITKCFANSIMSVTAPRADVLTGGFSLSL
jgi:hypothetical protein